MRRLLVTLLVVLGVLAAPAADASRPPPVNERPAIAAGNALGAWRPPAGATPPGTVTGVAAPGTRRHDGAALNPDATARALVLYDSTGPYAWLGEVYAEQVANLVSHFGSWTAQPVTGYVAGELDRYTAVVYVGSTYDEPVPTAFLDDVWTTRLPVLWVNDNIWQLTKRHPAFGTRFGFVWKKFDPSVVTKVRYKGVTMTRDARNGGGIMDEAVYDPAKAHTLAEAVRPRGSTFPWAIRSANFTYIGEIPFSYVTSNDRYLIFADLLFDLLAPATPVRHRALVRIEDVGPMANPADLRAVADYLYSRHVPFSVGVYGEYRDPNGAYTGGKPVDLRLADAPGVVAALKYMQARGGTLIMHGYTHQYRSKDNPYTGVSGDDFEFFTAHVDSGNWVRYDGPVPEDSAAWAAGRLDAGAAAFTAAGLATPTTFEFPHYAGSAADYGVVNERFLARYDRGIYYPGILSGGTIDTSHMVGQFFPYAVRDVYGTAVIPEDLGNIALEEDNHNPPRYAPDILASARRVLVMRDGVASFFYHPFLGTGYLRQVIEGMQAMGYTFVPGTATLR